MAVVPVAEQLLYFMNGPRRGCSTVLNETTGEVRELEGRITDVEVKPNGKAIIVREGTEPLGLHKAMDLQAARAADGRVYIVKKSNGDRAWRSEMLEDFDVRYAKVSDDAAGSRRLKCIKATLMIDMQQLFWQPRDVQEHVLFKS